MNILWSYNWIVHPWVVVDHVEQNSRMEVYEIRKIVAFDLVILVNYAFVDVEQ